MAENKEQWKARVMKSMGWTDEEAEEVYNADRAIDKGQRMDFDLTKEEEKAAKKAAGLNERTVKKDSEKPKTVRQKKENPTKAALIDKISQFLAENEEIMAENVQILNKERLISFVLGENTFELTLVQKRNKKN